MQLITVFVKPVNMSFEVNGKVAFVTGGANGIGFGLCRKLLENGAKGVAIVDIKEDDGNKALTELSKKWGKEKVTFLKTDVTDKAQLEDAFQKTIQKFQNLDIVFNNAGVNNEPNPEQVMSVNFCSSINCCLLALEKYLPLHRSTNLGVVVNTASVNGIDPTSHLPIYTATKFGVVGLTRGLADPLIAEKQGCKVFAICPGITDTAMPIDVKYRYGFMEPVDLSLWPNQSVDTLADNTMKLLGIAGHGSVWVLEDSEVYEVEFQCRQEMKKKK